MVNNSLYNLCSITLATATAVLRLGMRPQSDPIFDYISYCYGGIETLFVVSILIKFKITLATATAVLRLPGSLFFFRDKLDYISYCYGGIETMYPHSGSAVGS